MATSVAINRLTGTGPTYTRIDSTGGPGATRASTSDVAAPGYANPIPIPGDASVSRSYWVTFQLETLDDPPGTINNLKWYTDGETDWVGVTAVVAQATGYTQATGTVGVAGNALSQANYPTLTTQPVNAFTYTSASPLAVTGSTTTVQKFGNRVVLQIEVVQEAIAGTLRDESFVWLWDEV